jgi:hypothetical protein
MDLLTNRLCQAASLAPVAVTLHCEQILIDLSKFDGHRMLRILMPFAVTFANGTSPVAQFQKEFHPNVRLIALHVIAESLKYVLSTQLLKEMPKLVAIMLPSLNCSIVDLRKAVIFVLVEAYMVIGDALYPFVQELAPPQKKLLTIYIERAVDKKNEPK